MKRLVMQALLASLPLLGMAQFTLSGKVTDRKSNEILAGAHLILDHTFHIVISTNDGNYEIRNLKPGNYTLFTSYLGYKTDTVDFKIEKNSRLNIALQSTFILENEVEVRATRAGSQIPVAHQEITKKEISDVNFGQDLPILIGNSISAVTTSDAGNSMGYTAIRIRGTDMTRINVTVNGIPLNDPESHNVYWVDLPDFASSTDNIQIQRGVGTSTNGASAFGASINIQSATIKPEPYSEYSGAFGSFNSLKNSLSFGTGLIHNKFTFDGRISKLTSDGFIDRASSNLFSYYLSGSYSSDKNLVRINIFSGKEKTYQAWDGIPSEIISSNRTYNGMGAYFDLKGNLKYYSNETDNYTQTHYQALFSHQFRRNLILHTAVHLTKGSGYYEQYRENDELSNYGIAPIIVNSPYYIIENDTIATSGGLIKSSDLIRQKWLANMLAGLTWSLNFSSKKFESAIGGSWNSYTGNHFGNVIWTQFAGNSEINHEYYRGKGIKNDFNLFAKTLYALSPNFSAWGDLQFRSITYSITGVDDDQRNIAQEHNLNFFNPKVGLTYRIADNQSAYASLSIANREPNRDNYVDADQTKPSPKPETLYDAEAGYLLNYSKLSLSTNLYYMYYTNQLVLTGAINDVGSPIMINVPVSFRSGIELSANAFLLKHLRWGTSLTLSRNKIKSFIEFIDNWDTWGQDSVSHTNADIAFSPSVIYNSQLTWILHKNLNISLISKFVSKQFIDNTQSEDRVLDAYFVNNLLISYTVYPKFMKEITFSVMINNLLNEKYESNAWVYRYSTENQLQKLDGYFPQAGVNFMAGVSLMF